MGKKNLWEQIPEETLAQLTEEAFYSSQQKVRPFPARRMLAAAACLAAVVVLVNFDTAVAAVKNLLYFFPGFGVMSEAPEADYWIAEGEYTQKDGEITYFIPYLYRRGDTLALRVEKEVPGLMAPEEAEEPGEQESSGLSGKNQGGPQAPQRAADTLTVEFLDGEGRPIRIPSTSHNSFAAYDGKTGASFAEELELEEFRFHQFTLLLDGRVKIPVSLKKADPEDYTMARSVSSSDVGYTMELLPLNQTGSRFALIPRRDGNEKIPAESYWTPLSFDIAAYGESGTAYEAEFIDNHPRHQELYLAGLPQEPVRRVEVKGILESTRYEGSPGAIRIPALKAGERRELNQWIRLWNIEILATSAGLDEDGTLWVEVAWDAEEGRRLNQLDVSWPQSESYGGSIIRDGSYRLYHNDMMEFAGKKLTLPITFVSVVQEGEWTFDLNPS